MPGIALVCREADSSSDRDASDAQEDREDLSKRRQIYFCSRTHSQLSQFVSELHRTPFAASLSVAAVASRKVMSALSPQYGHICSSACTNAGNKHLPVTYTAATT